MATIYRLPKLQCPPQRQSGPPIGPALGHTRPHIRVLQGVQRTDPEDGKARRSPSSSLSPRPLVPSKCDFRECFFLRRRQVESGSKLRAATAQARYKYRSGDCGPR